MTQADLPFTKGHALGNDYIILEAVKLPRPRGAGGGAGEHGAVPAPALVRGLCDRHRGIGADGVLVVGARAEPVTLRIFNPDGREAEKSGNGLRIVAAYLHAAGRVAERPFPVALREDRVTLRVEGVGAGGERFVRAEMGRAEFGGASTVALALGDGVLVDAQPVSMGNPHCVVFVDALRRDEFLAWAPRLARHEAFPAGTNVQFARAVGPGTLEAWVWERGAGETLASGSSACAIAAAALRQGRVERRDVRVRMPGGELEVRVDDDGIELAGPAQLVCDGNVPGALVDRWLADG